MDPQYELPRVSVWTGEIPSGGLCDYEGVYMTDGPVSMAFNVIPYKTPLPEVINHLKANGGLKAYVSCKANRVGTVETEVLRLVSVRMSDQDLVRLVESLKSQPDGFVIYDMKGSEMFADINMWNTVTENAPGLKNKHVNLALCYNFGAVAEILDSYVTSNHNSRWKLGCLTFSCLFCTLGLSFCICDQMKKKYKLPNKRPLPREFGTMYYNGLVTN